MYHRRHFSFTAEHLARERMSLSRARGQLAVYHIWGVKYTRKAFAFLSVFRSRRASRRISSSTGKTNCAGRRKEIGKGTRKRYKGRNGPRKRTRDVCRALCVCCICICVCTYINIYTQIYTYDVYVYVCMCAQAGYIGFLWEPRDRPVSHYIVTRITYSVYLICEERSIKYCINI